MKKMYFRFLAIFCLLISSVANAQTNLYVDASVASSGNGSSWGSAYRNLNEALNTANSGSGKYNINIAQGAYYPTTISGSVATSRDSSFVIYRKGISIFGGYPSGGGTRNSKQFVTKISGDIGTTGTATDNIYHVLLVAVNTNNSDSLKIDGVNIEGGYANGSGTVTINSVNFLRTTGGGIYVNNSSGSTINKVYLTNCLIQNNYASSDGGGMENYNCTLNIIGCFFNSNSSSTYGAGLNNEAGGSLTVVNSIFSNNSNNGYGGAIRVSGSSTNNIINSTFVSNSCTVQGGAIRVASAGTATVNVYNCIFRGNHSSTDYTSTNADISNGATLTVTKSCLQSSQTCTSCLTANTDPLLTNISNPLGSDGFFGTADDGLVLTSSSPCINTGQNSAVSSYSTDITGATRIQSSTVDMGAYEFGPFLSVVAQGNFVALNACTGTALNYNSFQVSGQSLTNDLEVTAPSGFEVSTSINSGYTSSLSFTPSSNAVSAQTIYVRIASSATGSVSGDITISSTGATSQILAVSGVAYTTAVAPSVSINANPSGLVVSGTSVTFTASTTDGGSSPIYNFKVNGVDKQNGTSATYSSTSLHDGDVVSCELTANNICQTNATATSNDITMNICFNSSSTTNATICFGDSVAFNGNFYSTQGNYTFHFTNATGCDSTATLNLIVNNQTTSSTTTSACDSLVWNGATYTTSGTYTWGGTNAVGCDSTATLNLTVNYSSTSSTTTTVCDSLVWNGTTYTTSGTYAYITHNAVGCDSTVMLNLTVNYSSASSITTTVCDSLIWNGTIYRNTGTYTAHFTNAVGCDSIATLVLTVNNKPAVDSIVGLTRIEILAIGGGGGAGGPDGAIGAGGGAGGVVYGQYTLPANGSNIYTVGVGGAGGYGQGCAGNAAGGTAGANGGAAGGNAGTGGCSGGGGGSGGWSGLYQGSTYYVVAGGGAGGGGSNEGTANDVTTPGGGNQTTANGTSMTGQNGTAYSGDGGGGGAGGGGFYGGAGQSNLTQTGFAASQAWGGANYANPTNRNAYATYVGNSGATSATGTGGQGTTTTITNSNNFNYTNTYGKGGNAQGNGGTATTANGNNGVVIIRYQGSPVAIGGAVTQSGGYTLHTFTTAGSNIFRANSANAVCVGSTTFLSCATPNGVWSSSDTTIATIDASTGMVTGITPGVVTITYAVTNANGCVGYSTKQFTVNPLPTVPAITGTITLCDNTTTALSNTLTGGVWSSSLTSKATVNSTSGLVSGVAAGTSTITYLYTDNNGCSNTNSTVVTINASPTVAAITGSTGVCIGSTTTFSNVTLNGTWTSSNTNVATINNSGLITTVATGSSTISYTVINASTCTTFVTKSITVNALPNVTANATATTVCNGTSVTLTGGNASSYTWNNSVTNGIAFTATATNTYTVTGTDGNGCVKTANITINVNPLPVISINPSATTICNGYSSTLTASGANTYSWTGFGTSPVIDQLSVTPRLAVGLHKLKSSYSGSAIRIRRSSDNAEQDFGFSGNDLDVSAINTFVGASTGYVVKLYDQSGNGNHLAQATNNGQPLFISNGLNGKPVIRIQYSVGQTLYNTTNFGQPFTVVYAAKQTGSTRGRMLTSYSGNWLLGWWGGAKNTAYFEGWVTSGSSSSGDNNPYVYTGAGTSGSYQLYQNGSLIANNGGGSQGPNGISMGSSGCCYGEKSDGDFTDLYVFNSVLNTTNRQLVENNTGAYYGISGVASVLGATQVATPSTTTTYTVYGTDGNGCVGTATQTINVNPKPNAGADITNACGGSTQTLTGTANTGTWTALGTNPSGSTLSSTTSGVATVSFVNAATGTYSFIYTLPTTNCSDTMNIIVGAKPDAGADISSICGGNIISLSGTPNTGTWSAMSTNPVGGSSADAPFSASNSNLKLWIDATKFSTTNGNSLSGVITDASSYARGLTTNATYETTGFNGKPSVRYNNNQTATTSAFNTDQNTYVYTTVELVSAGTSWASVFYHWNRDGFTIEQNGQAANNVYHFQTGNDNSSCDQTISFGTKYIMAASITSGIIRNFTLYKDNNGTLQNLGSVSNSSYSLPVALGNLFLGKSDNGEYTNMRMGEFIYFQGSLPVSESSIINYLYSKWFNVNGNLTTTSGSTTINFANAATGTYNYIYTSPFGCTDTTSVFVTPKPNAGADINYLCGGATQVLNGTTTNGTWTAMSTNPTGANLGSTTSGAASVTFANLASGTYNFIYTLPTNCSDTMSITVRPKPNAGADQAVCILNVATGVTLTSNVTGVWTAKSGNAGTSNIISASTASTQVNNFSVIGDYNYINTNNGCTDTVKVTVTPAGSIGNYVWKDQNNDGLQNEPTSNGVNNITVELYKKDGNGAFNLYTSTITADNAGNPGYYNFGICEDGVYKVKVPTVNPFTQTHLTAQDATANTDGNSDINPADGFSPEITIDTHGSGVAKDNNTIDAGYQICTKPIAGADFNTCGGQFITITGVSTTPALPTTDGNWSALGSNPSGAILSATNLGVATIQFDSLAAGIYKFVYTVTGGCDDTLNIAVGAKPAAGSDLYEICGGSIIPVTGLPIGGTWSQAPANASGATVGATSNGVSNISFANLISGTYTFIYTTPFGCTDTMTISTKPKPNAGSDVYMECGIPRLFDTLSATPAGGTWTAMSGNPSGISLGTSASGKARINLPIAPVQGIWSFIYTAPNGCTDTMIYTIGVTGTPAPAINSGSSPICGNSSVQICPTQFGWSNYQWYKNGVAVSGINGTQACITVDTSKVGSYTLAGTNGSACWSKQSPAVVVSLAGPVTPTITVQGGSTTACNNGSITLVSSSQNSNQWNKDGVAISGATSQYFTASTSGVYTVTTTNCGYTRTSTGTTVTIVSYINISSIQASSGSVCTGSTLALSNTTTGGVWSSSNPSKATVNASTGVVSGVAVGSTTITYTVTISGCSNSVSYYLNVVDGGNIPTPTIVAQGSTIICGAGTVQLCTSSYGWSNYQWYRNGVAVALNGTSSCITVDTSKLGSYTLAATTGSGCWSTQSTAIAIGLPALPATPIITTTGATSVCNGATITLTSSSSSNNQWKKDGAIISGATSQTYTATNSGVYTVTVTNCAGSTSSAGTTLTIVPHITVNAIQSNTSSVCKNSSTTLTNTTSGGVWSSNNLLKATVNASTGVVTGVDTGVVTINYTVTISGCSNSTSTTLTIVDGSNITAPTIAPQSSASICSNGSVTICPNTFGWSNYQWYKDGVAVALNGTSSCITADTSKLGSYTLTATNGSGCWSPQSNAIVVSVATTPATPTISGAASTCNGQTVQLTSSSSTNNQWKKDGVTISGATGQSYTTTASGVYTVTVTNACGGSATSAGVSVSIGVYITVNSIQSVTGIVCKNATQTLINTTPNGIWTSNNTSVATVNPTTGLMTGIDTGIVTITYTVTVGGCSNFAAATFTIVDGSNIVPPTIVAQGSTSICSNGSVTLCPTAFGWSNYRWYKNGVLVSQNGAGACITVDTSKLGTYALSGTSGTGCWSSQSNAIVVSATAAPATPTVSLSGSSTICDGGSVVLTTSAASGNQWKKDGVAISGATSQSYIASASGVYTVTTTNCGGSTTSAGTTITVAAPIIVASITASGNTACMGSTITLGNATTGGVWSSSADTIATVNASGVVTPIKAGSIVISYTVTVGACSKAVTYNLTVPSGGAAATPTLDVRGATAICGSTVLQICPATYGWSNYQWYKNGIAIAAPTGTAACINIDTSILGSYTLAGTNGFGCWSAQSIAVPVTLATAPATPTVNTSGSTSVCNGNSVILSSSSSSNNQWYKDGIAIGGATGQTYAATISGVYKVAVTSNCGSSLSSGITVTVSAPITISSITSNSSSTVCFGNNVSLSCSTTGGVWSSNNTSVATVNASTGVVTTASAGTAVISYTVTVGACSNAVTYTLTVQNGTVTTPIIAATGGATTGSTAICGSGSLQMCPQSWGYSNYQWYKDGVAYSTSACITVNTAGSYTLAGTNGSGCWSAQSTPAVVTLNPIPTMVATTGPTAVCAGSSITLVNNSTIPSGGTGVWITGQTSNASVGALTGVVAAANAGNIIVKYTVTSAVGCTNYTNYNVTINAIPGVPSITYAPGTVNPQAGAPTGSFCANKTFTVVGTPSGGVWSKTGVINVTTPAGVVSTGSVAGAGTLKYSYTDGNGCANSRTMSGNVYICAARGITINEKLETTNEFSMYPNPAKSQVSINVETLVGTSNIVVTDLYGKVVKSQTLSMGTNTINISKLTAGMYFVSIITSEGKQTKKLIIE